MHSSSAPQMRLQRCVGPCARVLWAIWSSLFSAQRCWSGWTATRAIAMYCRASAACVRTKLTKRYRFCTVSCPDCGGTRLAEHARTSKINGKSIADISDVELGEVLQWLRGVDDKRVAPLVDVLASSLETAIDLGLGYLTLSRRVPS